jgi:predicted phosphodiesterase
VSRRTRQKQSSSQRILWILSLFLVGSMVISLVIVALPGPPAATPTPLPTFTPIPHPTVTASPIPTGPLPTATATFSPTAEATQPPASPVVPNETPTIQASEPPVGPVLPTETPTLTPTATVTPPPTTQATEPPAGPVLPTETPTTAPASAGLGFTFAVCGDSRGHPEIYRRILDAVTTDGSAFLIHTGDLVNQGTESLWQEMQQIMAGFALPFYPVPGNHDGLDGKLDNYLRYSGAPAAHYSFDQGPVHFALADSHNGGISAAERTWLRGDLEATMQPIKMVFLHHPPFDPDGTDHIMAYGNKEFMALMVEEGVDYVFAGHIHAYAREERDGVVYLYTGGGGAPLYAADHPQAFYHYLRVTVRGESVSIDAVKI